MMRKSKGIVRITKGELARLTVGRKSIERVAEILGVCPRYARRIELHGHDCDFTCSRMAEITGAREIDYIAPSFTQIAKSLHRQLVRAAEPARKAYHRTKMPASRRAPATHSV